MATDKDFSEVQQKELETKLVESLGTNVGAKGKFCDCWPCAKDVLELILKLPGLPAIVVNVIKGIIKAGDLASATVCKQPAR
jgi:hypothetical protein